MEQRFSLLEENSWEVLNLAESKTKSPLEQILQEDEERSNTERIQILEKYLLDAHKRLNIQHGALKALARRIKILEKSQ